MNRFKDPNYQGEVDHKLFTRADDIKRKTKYSRCAICNKDVESIFPTGTVTVGDKTFSQLFKAFSEAGARFSLIKREYIKYPLNYVIDEITLKPINGIAHNIDMDICRQCLSKMGHRHKLSKWQEKARFITNGV